jgi:hypothetical protein
MRHFFYTFVCLTIFTLSCSKKEEDQKSSPDQYITYKYDGTAVSSNVIEARIERGFLYSELHIDGYEKRKTRRATRLTAL